MTNFARHLAVFIALTLMVAGFVPQIGHAEDVGGHSVLGTINPIIQKMSAEEATRKSSGVPESILSLGFNPGCPPDVQAKLENRMATELKAFQALTKDQVDDGVTEAADANCFNTLGAELLKDVEKTWNSMCVSNITNIGNGGLKTMAKCMAMKIMQTQLQGLGKRLIERAKKKICTAVKDIVNRQLNQCIKVGFNISIQKPQFRGLKQCLVSLRAVGNLNLNLNSFTPLKDSSLTFSGDASVPVWEQFNAKCGATTVSDLPTALLTKDCWNKVAGNTNSGVKTCKALDPDVVEAIAAGEAAGDIQVRLLNKLSSSKGSDGRWTWSFKVSGSGYETDLSCYGYDQVASACATDPNNPDDTSKCALVQVDNYCCDPSKSACGNTAITPVCPNTCCDKNRNDCAALGVAECVANASCIGSMEKVFAVGANGAKTDTGKTAADLQLNSAEKTVWTKLKHYVKPNAEVAGKACCSTPWCNLCPQDIIREDYRLQGKALNFGPGVILSEGTSPPAANAVSVLGTSCGAADVRILPAQVMQFIFENRAGDKYTGGALEAFVKNKQEESKQNMQNLSSAIGSMFKNALSLGSDILNTFNAYDKATADRNTAAMMGRNPVTGQPQMIYQPLFAEGMPVNYAKAMVDGELTDVGLCSDLDFCPIDIDVDANGNPIIKNGSGSGTGVNTVFGGACAANTSSYCTLPQNCTSGDVACYNRCCGNPTSSSGGGSSTGGNTGNTGNTGNSNAAALQACQQACSGTDSQELACRRDCVSRYGGATNTNTGSGNTGGAIVPDNTNNGSGAGGTNNNNTSTTQQSSVVVEPTTQAPATNDILDTLKSLF